MEEMDTGEEGNEGIVGDDESIEFTRNNLASSNIDGQTSTSDIATEEFTSSRADVLRQQGNIKAATLRQQSGGNTQSASYSVIVKVLYEQNDYEVLLNKFNNLSNDEVIATLLKELYDELAIRYRASYNKRSSTYKVTTPDASAAIAAREYLNRKEVDFSRPGQEPVKIRLFAGTYGSLQGIHKVIDHPRTYSFTFSAPLGVVVASEQDTNEEPLQFTVENENDIIEFFNTRVAEKVLEAIFKEDPIPEKAGMTFLFEKNAQTATNKILASVTEECAEKIPEGGCTMDIYLYLQVTINPFVQKFSSQKRRVFKDDPLGIICFNCTGLGHYSKDCDHDHGTICMMCLQPKISTNKKPCTIQWCETLKKFFERGKPHCGVCSRLYNLGAVDISWQHATLSHTCVSVRKNSISLPSGRQLIECYKNNRTFPSEITQTPHKTHAVRYSPYVKEKATSTYSEITKKTTSSPIPREVVDLVLTNQNKLHNVMEKNAKRMEDLTTQVYRNQSELVRVSKTAHQVNSRVESVAKSASMAFDVSNSNLNHISKLTANVKTISENVKSISDNASSIELIADEVKRMAAEMEAFKQQINKRKTHD